MATIKDAALPMEDYLNRLRDKYPNQTVGSAVMCMDKETIIKEYCTALFIMSSFIRSGPYILSPEY